MKMDLQEVKDKISGYAALVADGHETLDDAWGAALDVIKCLDDEKEIDDAHDHLRDKFLPL